MTATPTAADTGLVERFAKAARQWHDTSQRSGWKVARKEYDDAKAALVAFIATRDEKIALQEIALNDLCVSLNEERDRIRELRKALTHSNHWVEAALECKNWTWDADQREAAEMSVAEARTVLAQKE